MMRNSKKNAWENYKKNFFKNKFRNLFSLILFGFSVLSMLVTSSFADSIEYQYTGDLLLDSFQAVDLYFLFTYVFLLVSSLIFLYPLLYHINKFYYYISQFALLVFIRSLFIPLTHLGAPPDMIFVEMPGFFGNFSFRQDFFFSGHTAVPFLGFLLFRSPPIKYFFIFASIFMAITVLAMHAHYSIDVFAAFFIAYGSYKIGQKFFKIVFPDKE